MSGGRDGMVGAAVGRDATAGTLSRTFTHGAVGTNSPEHRSGRFAMACHTQYAPHDVYRLPVHANPHMSWHAVPGAQSVAQNHSMSNCPHAAGVYVLSSSYSPEHMRVFGGSYPPPFCQ